MDTCPYMAPEMMRVPTGAKQYRYLLYWLSFHRAVWWRASIVWPGEGPAAFSWHLPGKVQVPGFSDDDTYCAVVTKGAKVLV